MIRLIRYLVIGTLVFHVVHSTYQINVLEQRLNSVYAVLGRMPAPRQPDRQTEQSFKKDAAAGLNTMLQNWPGPPHPSEKFNQQMRGYND